MSKSISDQQLALNRSLHKADPAFGSRDQASGLASHLPLALVRMHERGLCSSMLDYGTGKGLLVERLRRELPSGIKVTGYDPAVERWAKRPQSTYDILTCLDVLEHIEIDLIDDTIKDIKSLTKHFCFIIIDLQPAVKKLADGRNAHVLLAPSDWWVARFSQFFSCISSFPIKHKCGVNQKVILACTDNPTLLPMMYSFLNKINIYGSVMQAGTLNN